MTETLPGQRPGSVSYIEPTARIELALQPYHGCVLPLNYVGLIRLDG